MPDNINHKDILITKAKEDLATAKSLIGLDNFSEEIVLFHCEQAIEKVLKAYLDSKDITYPKIHDLEVLLSMCIEKDNAFAQINYVTSLTPYAIETRYDEMVELTKEETVEYVNQTEKALNFILNKTA